jgi:hypothetical protein
VCVCVCVCVVVVGGGWLGVWGVDGGVGCGVWGVGGVWQDGLRHTVPCRVCADCVPTSGYGLTSVPSSAMRRWKALTAGRTTK